MTETSSKGALKNDGMLSRLRDNRHHSVSQYRGHIWSNGFRASVLQVAVTRLSRRYIHRPEAKTCFGNEIRRNPEPLGTSLRIKVDVSGFDTLRWDRLADCSIGIT